MPVKVRKLPGVKKYRVYNPDTKKVYAKRTTKKKAEVVRRIIEGSKVKKITSAVSTRPRLSLAR